MSLPPLRAQMCFGCYTRFPAERRVGQADFKMERSYALGAAGDDEDKLFGAAAS